MDSRSRASCPPQKLPSRGQLQELLTMQAAQNRPGGDAKTSRQVVQVWPQLGRDTLGRIRNIRTQCAVRPSGVEVPNAFRQQPVQNLRAESDQMAQIIATASPDRPFANGVRLRHPDRRLESPQVQTLTDLSKRLQNLVSRSRIRNRYG